MYLQACEAGFSATLDFYHFLVGSHIKQTVKHHFGGRDRRGYKKRRKEKKKKTVSTKGVYHLDGSRKEAHACYLSHSTVSSLGAKA